MDPSSFESVDDSSRPSRVDDAASTGDDRVERWVSASAIAVVMIAGAAALLL